MRFVEAASKGNEPDEEAIEMMKKKFTNKQAPVVNFNYNSYIRIGALPPPVINTLIVNGNNYINQANPTSNLQTTSKLSGLNFRNEFWW